MRSVIMFLCLICLGASSHAADYVQAKNGKVLRTASKPDGLGELKPLSQYLEDISAYGYETAKIEKFDIPDNVCGDAHFISYKIRALSNLVQAEYEFYAQTLTKESQERLYKAIQENYAEKGLPECLMNDRFYYGGLTVYSYNYDPDYTSIAFPSETFTDPEGFPCAGNWNRPLTSCWNIKDPYANQKAVLPRK